MPGKGFPFFTYAVRPHDHRFCPVAEEIAKRAENGEEDWGTPHVFYFDNQEQAADVCRGIYRARKHGWSIQTRWLELGDGKYQVTARVWTREMGSAYIVKKVERGEPLAYNSVRKKA